MTDGKSSGRAADMEPIEEGQDRGNVIRGLELSERFFGEYERISRNPQLSLLMVLVVPLALSALVFTLCRSKLRANPVCRFGVNSFCQF